MGLKFVGLHSHSDSSVGDAIGKPEEHFDFVLKNAGEDSMGLAMTDHGNANSFGYVLQAAEKFKKKGINFNTIYGAELYLHPDLDDWKRLKQQKEEAVEEEDLVVEDEAESKATNKFYDPIRRRHHLVVLVKDAEGFKNLNRIITESYRNGFYRFPRTDFKTLEKYNKGLIISTACIHPDALIETNVGCIKMRDVVSLVQNEVPISVLAMDELTAKVAYHCVTWADCTRKNAKLLKIKLKDGKELKLTPDHKVFTDKGWVEAQYLTTDHKIMAL